MARVASGVVFKVQCALLSCAASNFSTSGSIPYVCYLLYYCLVFLKLLGAVMLEGAFCWGCWGRWRWCGDAHATGDEMTAD